MEHAVRGHDEAPRLPVHALRWFTGIPEQRVTGAAEKHDIGPGPVTVRLLVGTHRKLGDVAHQGAIANFEVAVTDADTPPAPSQQLEYPHVGHEVRLPHAAGMGRAVAAEV